MLGRGVAERLRAAPAGLLFAPEVVEVCEEADLFVLNLECCISERGAPWRAPGKPFFFRAPPAAVEALVELGVDCVTLANNHAMDFGADALIDTLEHLSAAGISCVGAGPNVAAAQTASVIESEGFRLAVIGVTDHPEDFAAAEDRPGVAYADLRTGVPEWLAEAIPLKLEFCYTRLADGDEAGWIRRRFRDACAAFGTEVEEGGDRLLVSWR